MKTFFLISLMSLTFISCEDLGLQQSPGGFGTPTEDEAGNGLKEALVIGVANGTDVLSRIDGFYGNNLVKIPWPEEAQFAADALKRIGMQSLVDKVELSLNRAAEKASAEAKDVFIAAIRQMTIQDAIKILLGGNGSATEYLRRTTTPVLTEKFRPIIETSLSSVGATRYWGEATTTYNKIPFVKPINTDLADFTTQKALHGLFLMIEKEENKIREDPLARTSALLKKVFGYADNK